MMPTVTRLFPWARQRWGISVLFVCEMLGQIHVEAAVRCGLVLAVTKSLTSSLLGSAVINRAGLLCQVLSFVSVRTIWISLRFITPAGGFWAALALAVSPVAVQRGRYDRLGELWVALKVVRPLLQSRKRLQDSGRAIPE